MTHTVLFLTMDTHTHTHSHLYGERTISRPLMQLFINIKTEQVENLAIKSSIACKGNMFQMAHEKCAYDNDETR